MTPSIMGNWLALISAGIANIVTSTERRNILKKRGTHQDVLYTPDKSDSFPCPDDPNNYPPSFLLRCVSNAYTWLPRIHHRGTVLELPILFDWAVDGQGSLEFRERSRNAAP